jgi:hypothetical protein
MEMDILVNAIRTPQGYSTSQSGDSSAWLHHSQTLKICQCSFVGGISPFQKWRGSVTPFGSAPFI